VGEKGRAEKFLVKANKNAPDNAAAHFNLGLLQTEQNRGKEAERQLKKAFRLDPKLAHIPRDFPVKPKSEFDKAYMHQLFDYSYNLAKAGYPWSKYPPDFDPTRPGAGRR
jgi:tetratricopeptide (TPR) repeat protein